MRRRIAAARRGCSCNTSAFCIGPQQTMCNIQTICPAPPGLDDDVSVPCILAQTHGNTGGTHRARRQGDLSRPVPWSRRERGQSKTRMHHRSKHDSLSRTSGMARRLGHPPAPTSFRHLARGARAGASGMGGATQGCWC